MLEFELNKILCLYQWFSTFFISWLTFQTQGNLTTHLSKPNLFLSQKSGDFLKKSLHLEFVFNFSIIIHHYTSLILISF